MGHRWRHHGPAILLCLLISLPALWPLYSVGLPQSADGLSHLVRLVALDNLLRAGYWYPRWMPQLVGGYGYPLLNFYAPGPYYLGEAFHLLGATYANAISLAYALMVLAGGAGMYLLATDIFSDPARRLDVRWPALISAVAFVYAPYLMVNIYSRGDIGETLAQALMPWILWSFRRVLMASRPGDYLLPAAASLASLALAHNISLLIFPPLLVLYVMVVWWQTGRAWRPLAWAAGAALVAMGLSAFFWAPLIGERVYLNDQAVAIAREWLQGSFWTWPDWRRWFAGAVGPWPSFLDVSLTLGYKDFSYQLRLVQLILAGIGFALARVRRAEWWFFGAAVIALCLAIFHMAEPIWLASPLLVIIQFPWRLLSIVNLLLALFTGGAITRLRSSHAQFFAGSVLVGIILLAQTPRSDRLQPIDPTPAPLNNAVVAQYERQIDAWGLSFSHDFILRWFDLSTSPFDPIEASGSAQPLPSVGLLAANPYGLDLSVNGAISSTLTLADSYYPAWRAVTGGGQALPTYPTTNLGVLTFNVPAGAQSVHIAWGLTPLVLAATLASLATLAGLCLLLWFQHARRTAVVLAGGLALGVVLGLAWRPTPPPVQTPASRYMAAGFELLGLQVQTAPAARVLIYPYWFVHSPSPDMQFEWTVLDGANERVAGTLARPLFQTQNTRNWPAGMVVDDAYQVDLPPGLPAGDYRLALNYRAAGPSQPAPPSPTIVGTFHLAKGTAAARPLPAPLFHLGDSIELNRVNLAINHKLVANFAARPLVRPGDHVDLTLGWSTSAQLQENYHGYVHLLDSQHMSVLKVDQTAGSFLNPSVLWDNSTLQPDVYHIVIPPDLPSGLYYPQVGLYTFRTQAELPVLGADLQRLPLGITLPPVKVLNQPSGAPQNLVQARFGNTIELWGYNLALPLGGLQPGSVFSLTLYYRSLASTPTDYTEFIHLYDPLAGQLAAQLDTPPQGGNNPTSAWLPGEVVVDRVNLSVSALAPDGNYTLKVGLYGSLNGNRLPVRNAKGEPLPNAEVDLMPLQVR